MKIEKFSFWNPNLIFSKKINIRSPGGEPAMVLRYQLFAYVHAKGESLGNDMELRIPSARLMNTTQNSNQFPKFEK